MIPITLLTKIIPKLNERLSKVKDSVKDQPAPKEDNAEYEDLIQVEDKEDEKALSLKQEHLPVEPTQEPSKIRGAGVDTFLALSDESLHTWYNAMVVLFPKINTSEQIDLSEGSFVSDIEVKAGSTPVTVSEDANATLQDAIEDKDKEKKDLTGLLFIFLIGLVGYFGVKLLTKNGKPLITIDKSAARGAIDKFSGDTQFANIYMPTFQYGEGGSLQERIGLGKYRVSTPYTDYSSFHGRAHHAIDISAPEGTPILAPADGVVTLTRRNGKDAGNYIEFRTDDGMGYRFLHLKSVDVKVGQRFKAGQQIAQVGNTGHSTGAHLHLEAYEGAFSITEGETMWRNKKLVNVNPLTVGAKYMERDFQLSEAKLEPGEVDLHVYCPKETAVGTKGHNYLSVAGNIKYEGRNGEVVTSRGLVFPTFESADKGIRAGAMNLKLYQTKHDVSNSGGRWTTIAEIATNAKGHNYVTTKNGDRIEEWVSTVSKTSGYTSKQRIDLTDPTTLARVVTGIARAEHSVRLDHKEVEQVINHYSIIDGIPSNKQ